MMDLILKDKCINCTKINPLVIVDFGAAVFTFIFLVLNQDRSYIHCQPVSWVFESPCNPLPPPLLSLSLFLSCSLSLSFHVDKSQGDGQHVSKPDPSVLHNSIVLLKPVSLRKLVLLHRREYKTLTDGSVVSINLNSQLDKSILQPRSLQLTVSLVLCVLSFSKIVSKAYK